GGQTQAKQLALARAAARLRRSAARRFLGTRKSSTSARVRSCQQKALAFASAGRLLPDASFSQFLRGGLGRGSFKGRNDPQPKPQTRRKQHGIRCTRGGYSALCSSERTARETGAARSGTG